jgi:hypothetical protein
VRLLKILILEDDLLTLSKLIGKLSGLEERLSKDKGIGLSILVLSEYKQVEKYINQDQSPEFDLVLLDRDCKLGGSFHTLNIQKFGAEKIVGISSVPEYNEALKKFGVTKFLLKDYRFLDKFSDKVLTLIEEFYI